MLLTHVSTQTKVPPASESSSASTESKDSREQQDGISHSDQRASFSSVMESKKKAAELRECELAKLAPLAREIPNIDSAVAEIARFSAELTLPRGTIHVISDIHGEDKKLRHIINNASGTLRPLVESLLKGRLDEGQFRELLTLIFYPAEVVERLRTELPSVEQQKAFA